VRQLRVALVNAGFEKGEPGIIVSPPLGIMCIGAYLRQNGFEVRLFDWSGEDISEGLLDQLKGFGPDIVGLTVIMGTSIIRSKRISSWAKDLGAMVVWGGPLPSVLSEMCLLQAPVDYLVMGEGEETMLELCRSLQEGRSTEEIPGLCFNKDGRVVRNEPRQRIPDLDALPMPWWEGVMPLDKYLIPIYGRTAIPFVSSRGCPGACSFCYTKVMWGYKWTSRSASKVVDEIQHVQELDPRIDGIIFDDDLFAGNVDRIIEFCKELKARGVDIAWNCEVRAKDIKAPLVKTMKAAGCAELMVGVETGSDRLLSFILKGVKKEQIVEAFRVTHEAGMRANAMLMVGIPGETMEDFQQTVDMLDLLKADGYYWSMYLPGPGTALLQIAKEHGFKEPTTLEGWATLFGYDVSAYPSRSLSHVPYKKVKALIDKETKRVKYRAYRRAIKKDPLGAISRGVRGKVKSG